MGKELVEIIRCKNCIHRPIQGENGVHDINPAKDSRGDEDYTCPCLNGTDYWYSWYPSDDWFCAEGESKDEIQNTTPEPCNFCSMIYPDDDTRNILFSKGKYSGLFIDEFITIDNEGKYWININPGDPYELGCLDDIKFCPYCGRKLAESEGV